MRRVLVVLTLCAASFSLPAQTGTAPLGWFLAGSKPQSYRTGVDSGTAFLASSLANTGGFGTLMQSISAQNYAGKRVRFHASVRSEGVTGWAGLWMRADQGSDTVAFDNMQSRAIKGTTGWTNYDVVLDIPSGATGLSFGTLVDGSGEVWLDHVSLEVVGNEVPATGGTPHRSMPLSPINLDFRQ